MAGGSRVAGHGWNLLDTSECHRKQTSGSAGLEMELC